MAEEGSAQGAAPGADPDRRVLLIVICSDPSIMDDVITALLDIGVAGATLVEGKGMAAVLRDEMPIFAGLVALLPEATGSRLLLSATTTRQADAFFNFVESETPARRRPIALSLPIERTAGLDK